MTKYQKNDKKLSKIANFIKKIYHFNKKEGETVSKQIEKKVKDIIAEQLGVELKIITDNSHLVDDLGSDSLDAIELSMALEEEFEIEISDDDMTKVPYVKDIVKYIIDKKGAQ